MPFQRLNNQELRLYLQRIQCNDNNLAADGPALETLHRQHAMNIPFENLNPLLGLPVSLTKDDLLQKIVVQQRGGYCFEHNLLLGHALTTLGFAVEGLAARVSWMLPPGIVMPRTHMVLLTTLNHQRYIADVGFGGLTLTTPLLLDSDAPQETSHETFRIRHESDNYILEVLLHDAWQEMYNFTLNPQTQPDFEVSNWFVATHPQSRFVNSLIAGRVDIGGRHALQNQHYTRHYLHKPSEKTELPSAEAIQKTLREQFLINTDNLPGLDSRLAALFTRP